MLSPEILLQQFYPWLIAGLIIGYLSAYLISIKKLNRSKDLFRHEQEKLSHKLTRCEAQIEAERQGNKEKLELLEHNRKQLEHSFQALSAQALESNNRNFLHLAKTSLSALHKENQGDLAQRQQAIDQLVQPLQESLTKVDHKIELLERARSNAYGRLDQQLQSLLVSQHKLEAETGNLVRALRAPAVRGRWGEIQLRKVVEMAGMVNYCDFLEQETADGGRLRPDMVIKLPNGRNIIVDSKAPLEAYLNSLESANEDERNTLLAQHARQIRDHVVKLAGKNYWEQFQPTPEFVVLFLPAETFFSAALAKDPSLIEAGVDRKVLLATPTTLIALLRSVAYGWRQEKLTENAEAISQLGREMYDRLATMHQYFLQLGKNLERSVDSYNRGIASLDSRVMVTARKFKDLGAGTSKTIEPPNPIDTLPRIPQSTEE